jgi:aldose 1-epimerase
VIERRAYGRLPDGRSVEQFLLANGRGLRLSVLSYGGIVNGLWLDDTNLVLGFDRLQDYIERNPFFGIIVGRYGNRIAGGRFRLDGEDYQLDQNDGSNCLHGGTGGFGTQLWQVEEDAPRDSEAVALRLSRVSEHGEQGFPGRLEVSVRYALLASENSWRIDYQATTDRPTVVNLTHHGYYNLAGGGSIARHELTIPASRYTQVDDALIPLQHATVEGTPFDFRQPTPIGARLKAPHPQLLRAKGYDHNWVIDRAPDRLRMVARLADPDSGRQMEILSTEPALQFYSGNFLDGSLTGLGGQRYEQHSGLCLETQHSPDSPNREAGPDWPSTTLRPGQIYRSCTLHRFPWTSPPTS